MTFIRLEPMTVFLSVAMALFLMGVFALTYLGGEWIRYSLLDYIFGYLRLFGSMIARPLGFAAEIDAFGSAIRWMRSAAFTIWPILRGIVIALPVIAIFASLLSSADPIFAKRFEEFIELFKIENLPEYIFRLCLYPDPCICAGGHVPACRQSQMKKYRRQTVISPFLGFTESAIVLGSVIDSVRCICDHSIPIFLWWAGKHHIEGYTFSEYARKGFGELVAVAFFSLLCCLGWAPSRAAKPNPAASILGFWR